MSKPRLGIVGNGFIASVIARAANLAQGLELTAVSARSQEKASGFASEFQIPHAFEGHERMFSSGEVDVVYVATPTHVREEICLSALNKGLHLLGDKPFASLPSLQKMTNLARENGLVFMDATHFTHTPRTAQIREEIESSLGAVEGIRSSFFFPSMDRQNIRFDTTKEPTGCVGDMAWYSMRAIVEYMPKRGKLVSIGGHIVRDEATGAVIRGSGYAAFESGATSTFDFGYSVGGQLMDLDILGREGVLQLSDFVLDWKHSFAFNNPDHKVGYLFRKGPQAPFEGIYIEAQSDTPQEVLMLENLARQITGADSQPVEVNISLSEQTQGLVDAFWASVR